MKITILAAVLSVFASVLQAQEIETDLPKEKKTARNESYFHDETPLNATHSIYSDIFIHKWLDAPHDGMDPIPQAEQDRISDTFIAHWRAQAEAEKDPVKRSHAWSQCGDGLIYRGMWDKAEKAYRNALCGKNEQNLSRAWNGIAQAQLGAGRKKDALATINEFLSLKLKSGGWHGRRRIQSYHNRVYHVKHWLEGRGLDSLKMPRYTGCRAFPEAQKADYSDRFIACPAIVLELRNIEASDARVRLLAKKLKSRGFGLYGGSKRGRGYRLSIALDKNAPVDRSEGYYLKTTPSGAEISARDRQGVLWGIVSFLQILDAEKKRVRIAEIEDWPACPKRGFLGRIWTGSAEYAVFNKMNIVTIKPCYLALAEYTPFNLYCTAEQCREFNDLGLEIYGGFANMTMDCAWPLCWNVTAAMQIENMKKWASVGLNVYYPYDDARYWKSSTWTKEDRESGLLPSDTDAKHLLKVYTAVKKEYPDFKMQFCPPFYWGPTAGHPYPDSRNKYLKSLRMLPEEISVFWTGERVGSHRKERGDCKWYTNLIGRKPSLFQNKTGPHYYLSYIVDRTEWGEWYYPGFVEEDMRSIQKNSDTPTECPQISTLADYLWNPKAYDSTRSVKRGLENYAGKGLFEILDRVHPILCRYDKYKYGKINGRIRFETLEKVEADLAAIEKATAEAQALVGTNFFNSMGAWNRAVGWVRGVRRYLVKNKDKDYRAGTEKYIANAVADAVAFAGYDKDRHVLLDGYMFAEVPIAFVPSTRRGAKVPDSRLIANFSAWERGVATFKLAAVRPGARKACFAAYGGWKNLAVEINGVKLLDGRVKAVSKEKSAPRCFELDIPPGVLRKGENTVSVFNKNGRAFFELVYCVIK